MPHNTPDKTHIALQLLPRAIIFEKLLQRKPNHPLNHPKVKITRNYRVNKRINEVVQFITVFFCSQTRAQWR